MDGVGFWAMEDIRKEDEAMAAALEPVCKGV
jgi:hypothetical protein